VNTKQLLDEIRDANLSYLILAQHLIRADRAEALYRLGISEEVADLLDRLTTAQMLKIAATNMLMCRFRFDDSVVWRLLTNHAREEAPAHGPVSGVHAAILMASALPEAA
jgi:flagellar transcriptional activator FlhD